MQYHVYTTGDQLWTSQRDGQRVTVKLITSDGLVWEEGDVGSFRKLSKTEKVFHQVTGFCISWILKVLNA